MATACRTHSTDARLLRPATGTDQFGCPAPTAPVDSDADGVSDSGDRCPGTPAGTAVDALGCPRPPPLPAPPTRTVLHDVTFATGSATLTPAAQSSLRTTAASLLSEPAVRSRGGRVHRRYRISRLVNERLSLARARIGARLPRIPAGIPADRLTARGYGPADPVASNATAEGRELNRRVELRPLD